MDLEDQIMAYMKEHKTCSGFLELANALQVSLKDVVDPVLNLIKKGCLETIEE